MFLLPVRLTVPIVLVQVLAFVPAVLAQPPRRLEPVVVTATRVETPAGELGAATTVIPGEEFATHHYATVDEALRRVPGVEVQRSGSLGKLSSITIRGSRPQQVQVLIDGTRAKSPTSGIFDLSDVSPELIERIEVIRGPQSTLYGADAIGGVVNIITKKGTGAFSGSVQQEAGNYDTLGSRATVLGRWRLLDYALSGSHLESNGLYRNDDSDRNAANLRLGLGLPWDGSVSLAVRWNDSMTGLAVSTPLTADHQPVVPVLDINAEQESETLTTTLTARVKPRRWWESEVRLGRLWNRLELRDEPDPGAVCPFPPCEFPSRTTVERREVEWLNHFHAGTWSTTTVGIEYRHEEGTSRGSSPFQARSHTPAAFFQQQLRFFERLFLVGGVRIEDHSVFGTEVTERGSLAYTVKAWGTTLRGGAGSGFRAPTFVDLFFPVGANPGLEPEHSFSYDFGVDQRLWNDRLRLGLTYFHNRYDNLIACCALIAPGTFAPTNVGRARSAGIEFTAEADLLDALLATLNYTYTDSENLITDRWLPRQPQHRWNGSLTWEAIRGLSLFTQLHVATRQFETFGNVWNRGHTRIDLGGTWRVVGRHGMLEALDLTARVQNLLDEEYAEVRGFPAPGINALVGLRASF